MITGGTDWLIKQQTKNVFVMRTAEEFLQKQMGMLVGSYTGCNGVTAERLQTWVLIGSSWMLRVQSRVQSTEQNECMKCALLGNKFSRAWWGIWGGESPPLRS